MKQRLGNDGDAMPLIEVTESAADQIRTLLEREGKAESHGLRMKAVGGG